jgi:hypothetical protein
MSELDKKITIYLGRKPNFSSEVILQDDGNGSYIKEWNINGLVKPTEAQLNALDAQANTLEASNQVIANRKAEYPSIEELVVALYDTEDKLAIENKRKAVKDKYPK